MDMLQIQSHVQHKFSHLTYLAQDWANPLTVANTTLNGATALTKSMLQAVKTKRLRRQEPGG
jgi:hypothetical protein